MQPWLERVRTIQQAHASPELIERVRQQAEAASRQAEAQKKCRRLSTSNHLSSAAWRSASRDISVAEASPIADFARTSTIIADRATSAMRTLDSFTSPVRFVDDEALISRGLAQTAEALVADGSVPAAYLTLVINDEDEQNGRAEAAFEAGLAHAHAAEQSELQEVLRQLEVEPPNAEACAVKFRLFEQYASSVSNSRQATLALWEEVKGEFAGATSVRCTIEHALKAIDQERNLGIAEDTQVWFVHAMTAQAARNARALDTVLSTIRTKLGLLSAQHTCPVCYESFTDAAGTKPATTLGCAHKVCTECWSEWRQMQGARAFCPLCRHDEFLHAVLPAGSASGHQHQGAPDTTSSVPTYRVTLHKPDASARLGITLINNDGQARGPPAPIITALAPGCLAADSGRITINQLLVAVNGQRVHTHEEATALLRNAVGDVELTLTASGGGSGGLVPPVAGGAVVDDDSGEMMSELS